MPSKCDTKRVSLWCKTSKFIGTFKKIVTRELLNIFFSGKQLSIIELLIYDMEIVSVQRKNYLCLLFRFIKVYTKRISWRAIAGDPGRSSKLSVKEEQNKSMGKNILHYNFITLDKVSKSNPHLVGFLTSTTRLYRGWAPRQSVWEFNVLPHIRKLGDHDLASHLTLKKQYFWYVIFLYTVQPPNCDICSEVLKMVDK